MTNELFVWGFVKFNASCYACGQGSVRVLGSVPSWVILPSWVIWRAWGSEHVLVSGHDEQGPFCCYIC